MQIEMESLTTVISAPYSTFDVLSTEEKDVRTFDAFLEATEVFGDIDTEDDGATEEFMGFGRQRTILGRSFLYVQCLDVNYLLLQMDALVAKSYGSKVSTNST